MGVRVMPLALAPMGKGVLIFKVMVEDKIKRHLANLGILPGEIITPMSESEGDLIIKVRGSRLAINKGLAIKILVK